MSLPGALASVRVETPHFIRPVEAVLIVASCHLHLFAAHLQMVQKFHRLASIPWLHWTGAGVAFDGERQSVIEIERDGRVGIDLKFGTIAFKQAAAESYAVALVDVIVGGVGESGTRVQMEVKVLVDPDADSILGTTEKCRAHIVSTLRAAAETFDSTSARALLFHDGKVV